MGFGKCHLFFSCGIMKFFLFLLFLLLLFDSPQGSTISLKRSVRALNTTLQTNFNGTYERRNPCTNAEIETTSYVASHEFHHHTKEDNWGDYTRKCSSIISSFLKALGNLVRFNHNENGIFNFHINTSISQKQDGHCEFGKRTTCNSLPTITIEATDCEISPKTSCGNLADDGGSESFSEIEIEGTDERKSSACAEDIKSEMPPTEAYVNEDLLLQTPPCQTKIPSIPLEDATAVQAENPPEADDMWIPDDIFLPTEETPVPPETQFPRTSALSGSIRTKDSSRAINDPLGDMQSICGPERNSDFFETSEPENYIFSEEANPEKPETEAAESFSESSPDVPYYLTRPPRLGTTPTTNPYNEEQFSNEPFLIKEQQPTGYSRQLFNDNMNEQVPLSDQPPADSFASDQNPSFNSQDQIPNEIYQPENSYKIDPISFQPSSQTVKSMRQNEEIYTDQYESLQQPQQSEEDLDNFPDPNIRPIKTDSYSPQAIKYDETPSSEMRNLEAPQMSNFNPSARESLDYVGQTPTLEFAMSYPVPLKQTPIADNSKKNFNEFTEYDGREDEKLKSQDVDYANELSKAKSSFKNSDTAPTGFTFPPDGEIAISDKLFTFNVKNPQSVTPSWTPQEQFPTKTTSPESFETPFSSGTLDQNSDENVTTDPVTDSEFLVPSEQYQPTARPDSQSLLKYDDQYDNDRESESAVGQAESEFLSNKPFLPFSPTFPSNERTSSLESAPLISPNQKLPAPLLTYENPLNYASGPSLFQKQTQPEPESFLTIQPFPEENPTTLPSDQEDPEQIIPTFSPYQNQPNFSETETASPYPDQTLTDTMATPILDSSLADFKKSTETFFDDYEDPLYSKPEIEPPLTTPTQFESTPKPFLANDPPIYEKALQPTDDEQQFSSFDSDAQRPEEISGISPGFDSTQSRPSFNGFPMETLPSEKLSEPYLNQYAQTSNQPERNPTIPYAENSFQEDETLRPYEKDNLPSEQTFETPLSRDSNIPEISEQVTTVENEKQDFQSDLPLDSEYRYRKFSPRLIKTPMAENSMNNIQTEELTSLDQSTGQPPQFEERVPAFSTPTGDLNENHPDFFTKEDLKQSTTQIYAKNKPLSAKTSPPYTRKQYSSAGQSETVAFPEYDDAYIEYQTNEKPAGEDSEIPMPNYNERIVMTYPPIDQQSKDTFEEESTAQFSDFNPKEPSADFVPVRKQPFIQTYSDSIENPADPNSEIVESQSLTSDQLDDQILPLGFEAESNEPFNNEPPTTPYEQTSLQMNPLELTNNQPFQVPYTQSEEDPSYPSYPLEGSLLPKDLSQSSDSSADNLAFVSTPVPEIETNGMDNKAPDQQYATQPQLDQTYEKQSTDYPSFLESSSQIQLSQDDYDKKISDSMINTAPQSEYSPASQTSFEEYTESSLNQPTAFNPSYSNERPESQYSQEEISDYSSGFSSESQLQPLFDYSTDISKDNKAERIPQPNDSDYSSTIEIEPERLANDNNSYSQNTEYYQNIKSKYLDEPPNTNINTPTSDINTQNEEFLEPSYSVTDNPISQAELYPNEFASPPLSSAFPSYLTPINVSVKPGGSINQPSESNSIPLRDVSEKQLIQETSKNFDYSSEQSLPPTAVKYEDEITDFSQTFKPQPQRLDWSNKSPDSQGQQFPVTSYADSSEFEPTPISSEKGNMDSDSTYQPSLLLQPRRPSQLDTFASSPEEAQNDFDSNLPPYTPLSPSFSGIRAKTLDQEFETVPDQPAINSEYSSYNNEQQLPPYNNQYKSRTQMPSNPGLFGRFSPRFPTREPQYLNDDTISNPESEELTALNDNEESFNSEHEITAQTPPQNSQKPYPNVFDASFINDEENQPPNSLTLPNQYPNYASRVFPNEPVNNEYNNEPESPSNPQPIAFDSKALPEYFVSKAEQDENSFERTSPLDSVPHSQKLGTEPDQMIPSFSPYDEYDQIPSEQLSNEKLLEYDEEIEPNLKDQKSTNVEANERQNSDMAEQSLEDLNDYQDRSTPDNEPRSFPSSPAHSNPLIQTLEHHLNFPMQEHLGPPSFSDPEQVSPIDPFPFDPRNRGKFRGASAVPLYSEERNFEDIVNAPQSDSHALVSDPNTPSKKPGEDSVSCCGSNTCPLLCPFDPILKGNMTAPSYYILISKLPVDNHGEERFKVEKVYLGDGTPLNCTLSTGKTFPTWLYTPIPLSAADTVKLRTKTDFA